MTELKLPQVKLSEGKGLRENIQERNSNRSFDSKKTISIEQLSALLWATYGKKIENKDVDAITQATYTIPSAGAIYSLEIFVLVGKDSVENLKEGLHYYVKEKHALRSISNLDTRKDLASVCLGQKFIEGAPISLIIAADFGRMAQRYGSRAERYVLLEAGHAAQNLYLIANDLGLSTVEIGAFDDKETSQLLDIDHQILLIFPIGYKK